VGKEESSENIGLAKRLGETKQNLAAVIFLVHSRSLPTANMKENDGQKDIHCCPKILLVFPQHFVGYARLRPGETSVGKPTVK